MLTHNDDLYTAFREYAIGEGLTPDDPAVDACDVAVAFLLTDDGREEVAEYLQDDNYGDADIEVASDLGLLFISDPSGEARR